MMTSQVPEPASPTGQYPDPVWTEVDYTNLAEASSAIGEIPAPPSATGQYPDSVWAEVDYPALVDAASAEEEMPAPPSPTGQYPDPVWANVDYSGLAEAASTTPEPAPDNASTAPPVALDNQEIYQIIRAVAAGISGEALYEYVDTNAATTDGLRVGLMGFRQASGELGQLLTIMQRRDPSLLAVVLGPDTEALLKVTNADSHAKRLQPVGGQPLWHQSWQEKFRQAGQQPVFQAAQNETAIEHQFRPLLDPARALKLHTDRGLALLLDRAVALGPQAGVDWLQQRLLPANEASEMARLQALLQAAAAETKPRLLSVFNSSLLDGTSYTF